MNRARNSPEVREWRSERLLADARIILCLFSAAAVHFDPIATRAGTVLVLLGAYFAFSVVVRAALGLGMASLSFIAFSSMTADLMASALLVAAAGQESSYFFTYFFFTIIGASIRWRRKGVVVAALLSLACYLAASHPFFDPAADASGTDLKFLVMRSAFICISAFLLFNIGGYIERREEEMRMISGWPKGVKPSMAEAVRESLSYAAMVMGAERVALVWEDLEEPWFYLEISNGQAGHSRERIFPEDVEKPVEGRPDGRDYVFHSGKTGIFPVFRRWNKRSGDLAAIHPLLYGRLNAHTMLGVEFSAESVAGWVFFLDRENLSLEDLPLARAVAAQISMRMTQARLVENFRVNAAAEERVRLARDLHDGVLQSLAAAGFKLEEAKTLVQSDAGRAFSRIGEVQTLLVEEQVSLREISASLVPASGGRETLHDLSGQLKALGNRIQRYWGLDVGINAHPDMGLVPGGLAHEACRIAHEALVNAARHGKAAGARVDVGMNDGVLQMTVEDDGKGFSFTGTFSLQELTEMRLGPLALKERVRGAGGDLFITSGENGTKISITLPVALERKEAR